MQLAQKTGCLLLGLVLIGCGSEATPKYGRLGDELFTAEAWKQAKQEERGAMVYSFMSQHKVIGMDAREVKELLGESTGYYDYDSNPAYLIGPQSVSSQYGKGYLLYFVTDKTTGKINSHGLIPPLEK